MRSIPCVNQVIQFSRVCFRALICTIPRPNGIMAPRGVQVDHHPSLVMTTRRRRRTVMSSTPPACMPRRRVTLSSALSVSPSSDLPPTFCFVHLGPVPFNTPSLPNGPAPAVYYRYGIGLLGSWWHSHMVQLNAGFSAQSNAQWCSGSMNGALKVGGEGGPRRAGCMVSLYTPHRVCIFQYLFNKLHVKTLGAGLVEMIII